MSSSIDVVIEDSTSCTERGFEPLAPSDPNDPNKPAHFDFITENVYISPSLQDSKSRKKAKRMICNCQFDPEFDKPEEACGENCLNRLLMIECGSRCPCGQYCTNKNFQRAGYAKVEVFKTEKKGWGLRARELITEGLFVMEYCGEVCTISDFEQRKIDYSKEKRRHYYFMSLKTDQILDATRRGNLSRFINHSCDPNCETQKWTVNGRLCIGFFSVRKIGENEELTFDYQFQRFGDVAQKCYCGSENCRGFLGQTKQGPNPRSLAPPTQSTYQGTPHSPSSRKRHQNRLQSDADSAFEKDIYDLVGSSWRLKNSEQVIAFSRTMLQAESPSQRTMLLQVLQATDDVSCLKKFLSLQGLKLLWSWMVDSADLSTLEVMEFRIQALQTLAHLPVSTKNQLDDSKLLPVVTRWAEPAKNEKSNLSFASIKKEPPETDGPTVKEGTPETDGLTVKEGTPEMEEPTSVKMEPTPPKMGSEEPTPEMEELTSVKEIKEPTPEMEEPTSMKEIKEPTPEMEEPTSMKEIKEPTPEPPSIKRPTPEMEDVHPVKMTTPEMEDVPPAKEIKEPTPEIEDVAPVKVIKELTPEMEDVPPVKEIEEPIPEIENVPSIKEIKEPTSDVSSMNELKMKEPTPEMEELTPEIEQPAPLKEKIEEFIPIPEVEGTTPMEKEVEEATPMEKKVEGPVPMEEVEEAENEMEGAIPMEKEVKGAMPMEKETTPMEEETEEATPMEKEVEGAMPIEKEVKGAIPMEEVEEAKKEVEKATPMEKEVEGLISIERGDMAMEEINQIVVTEADSAPCEFRGTLVVGIGSHEVTYNTVGMANDVMYNSVGMANDVTYNSMGMAKENECDSVGVAKEEEDSGDPRATCDSVGVAKDEDLGDTCDSVCVVKGVSKDEELYMCDSGGVPVMAKGNTRDYGGGVKEEEPCDSGGVIMEMNKAKEETPSDAPHDEVGVAEGDTVEVVAKENLTCDSGDVKEDIVEVGGIRSVVQEARSCDSGTMEVAGVAESCDSGGMDDDIRKDCNGEEVSDHSVPEEGQSCDSGDMQQEKEDVACDVKRVEMGVSTGLEEDLGLRGDMEMGMALQDKKSDDTEVGVASEEDAGNTKVDVEGIEMDMSHEEDLQDVKEGISCEAEVSELDNCTTEEEGEDPVMPPSQPSKTVELQCQLEVLAQDLLGKWATLKEVFRIPKRAPPIVKRPATPPESTPEDTGDWEEQEEEPIVYHTRRKGHSRGRRETDHSPYHHHHHHHYHHHHQHHRSRKSASHSSHQSHSSHHHPSSPHTPSYSSSPHPPSSYSHTLHQTPPTVHQATPTTVSYSASNGPMQSTVIVQQQGQSLYVQQQIFRNGCQTTILPTQYIPAQTTPPSYIQLQQTRLPSIQPLLPNQSSSHSPQVAYAPPINSALPASSLLSTPTQLASNLLNTPTTQLPQNVVIPTTSVPSLFPNPTSTPILPNQGVINQGLTPTNVTRLTSTLTPLQAPTSGGLLPLPNPYQTTPLIPGSGLIPTPVNTGLIVTPSSSSSLITTPISGACLTPLPNSTLTATPSSTPLLNSSLTATPNLTTPGLLGAAPPGMLPGITPILAPGVVTPSGTPNMVPISNSASAPPSLVAPVLNQALQSAAPQPQQVATPSICLTAGSVTPVPLIPPNPAPASSIQLPSNQTQIQQVQQPIQMVNPSPLSLLPLPPPPPDKKTEGLPPHWKTAQDSTGKVYYYHAITRKTQWERPTEQDEGTITMELATPTPERSSGDEDEEVLPPLSRGPHTPTEDDKEYGEPSTPEGTPPPLNATPSPRSPTPRCSPSPAPENLVDTTAKEEEAQEDVRSHIDMELNLNEESSSSNIELDPTESHSPCPHTPPFSPPPPSREASPLDDSYMLDDEDEDRKRRGMSGSPPPKKRRKTHKERQQKEEFRHKLSRLVTSCLDQHRKSDCKYGRITCAQDFKYLARKLTYGLTEKEVSRKRRGNLDITESVKTKVKEYIRQYMKKLGPVFKRVTSPIQQDFSD